MCTTKISSFCNFMEKIEFSKSGSSIPEKDELEELLQNLPKERSRTGTSLYLLYQGFWCPYIYMKGVLNFQRHFQARDTDLILASCPKSGTTWLKALMFTIVNRTHYTLKQSPLLISNPHELVPFTELDLYMKNSCPNLENLPRPRIFATHVPYASLPCSIKDFNCQIVYICRNPFDQLISHWHFTQQLRLENVEPQLISLDEAFEMFLEGIHGFGPFWNHALGFWKASLESPNKVLFLKYEDMKEDITSHLKRLAEFLGFPFSSEEEKQGVVEEISRLCSFENLKALEANKSGVQPAGAPNSSFFRKGKVGDWRNYLTPSMTQRMEKLVEEKFGGSGLTFKLSCPV